MSGSSVANGAQARLVRIAPVVGLVLVLLTEACSGVKPAPPPSPPGTAAPQTAVSPGQSATNVAPPDARARATATPSPAPATPPAKKEPTAQDVAKRKTPPLDLASLEQRLKDTKAVGLFTKIALKNQVDDLVNQFRAFHQEKLKTTLAELRRQYDLLVLKVLALLQDNDPALAAAIAASREAIWAILSDPTKLATI